MLWGWELNTGHVLDHPESSRTEFKPMLLERNPYTLLNVFSHQAYVGVYDLRSLEREPEVHLSLGTD